MAPSDRKGPSAAGSLAQAMQAAQPYMDAAWQLAGALGMCALAGWWLDKKFGTTPWFLLGGAMLGLSAGMYSFIRQVMYLANEEEKKKALRRDGDEASSREKDP